jgi:hypothetical protein
VKVLSRAFRGKFLTGLKRLHRRQQLRCAGPAAALANPKQFHRFLRRLHRQDWVVYAKPAFGWPREDYANGGNQRTMTLLGTEFLRHFFLHVLPKGFARIGILVFSRIDSGLCPSRSANNCWRAIARCCPLPRKPPPIGTFRVAGQRWWSVEDSPRWNSRGALTR